MLVIGSLGQSLPEPVPTTPRRLVGAREADWDGLGRSDQSAERVSAAMDDLRSDVLAALKALDQAPPDCLNLAVVVK